MSFVRPDIVHPSATKNGVGYLKKDYQGVISTLCAGCGHDSITAAVVQVCYDLDILPHKVAKMSGIGCSSKTPPYFLSNSHGFNSLHGRMPSVTTGANMANRDLIYLGISGDGDSASIGIGQLIHAIRRNVNMTYLCMNNGCYGLTKGQDSATADIGSLSKAGSRNQFSPVDLVGLALEMGAGFVARSFSGDKGQLIPLLKSAIKHPGFAIIDVISPCVTFNNNTGSTKSYDYVRQHIEMTSAVDFVPEQEAIEVDYPEGTSHDVSLHDDTILRLSKLADNFDPFDRRSAVQKLNDCRSRGEILTGLLYIDRDSQDLHAINNTVDVPLNSLGEEDLCPGQEALVEINRSFS